MLLPLFLLGNVADNFNHTIHPRSLVNCHDLLDMQNVFLALRSSLHQNDKKPLNFGAPQKPSLKDSSSLNQGLQKRRYFIFVIDRVYAYHSFLQHVRRSIRSELYKAFDLSKYLFLQLLWAGQYFFTSMKIGSFEAFLMPLFTGETILKFLAKETRFYHNYAESPCENEKIYITQ